MNNELFDHLKAASYKAMKTAQSTLNDDTVRLAVTGLSRSGKTVFITSLINNLLSVAKGNVKALPQFFYSGTADRVASARITPYSTDAMEQFDYVGNLSRMAADDAQWPARTEDMTRISLELVMRRKGNVSKLLGDRKITLEILDYPGEWLMDLPLLDRNYAQWSEETLKGAVVGVRASLSKDFVDYARTLNPNAPASDRTAKEAHGRYKDYLNACRDRQLRFLQPGRFLCPGPWGAPPLMFFCPLPDIPETLQPDSLAKLMSDRFEAYKADMRAKFFEDHFQKFDRQIVLVDVLGALHAGKDALEDTRQAIAEVAGQFQYGGSLLMRAFGKRIDRVYIASTKVDHVPESKRTPLQFLLQDLAGIASQRISMTRTKVAFGTLASVRCTLDDHATLEGQTVEVVKGISLGSGSIQMLFPGDIPVKLPPDTFWKYELFKLPIFRPPKIGATGAEGIPHIGLDEALTYLLGDKL